MSDLVYMGISKRDELYKFFDHSLLFFEQERGMRHDFICNKNVATKEKMLQL